MGYKQPRVPQKQPGMSQEEYLRALTLFLKDFCMETWTAVTRGKKDGGEGGKGKVTSVNGEGPDENGNVQLNAADVGARPDSWTPSAADVGALPAGGTAKDSAKLGGVAASEYAKKTDIPEESDVDLLSVYPVGSIYMSASNTSPASLFGGTWERLKDRFLLGAGDSYSAGYTGGEAEVTLTVNQMPRHNHSLPGFTYRWGSDIDNVVHIPNSSAEFGTVTNNRLYTDQGAWNRTDETGGSQAHNNMPPYLAVYMWKRVS